jgi:hypothetical protein
MPRIVGTGGLGHAMQAYQAGESGKAGRSADEVADRSMLPVCKQPLTDP